MKKPTYTLLLSVALVGSALSQTSYTSTQIAQLAKDRSSGEFLLVEPIRRISTSLEKNTYRIQFDAFEIPLVLESQRKRPTVNSGHVRYSSSSGDRISYTGNAIRIGNRTAYAVGQPAEFIIALDQGRLLEAYPPSDEDILRLRMQQQRSTAAAAGQSASITPQSELKIYQLQAEIEQLRSELRTGVAGTSTTQYTTTRGEVATGRTTHRFTEAEMQTKRKLLALKEAELELLLNP